MPAHDQPSGNRSSELSLRALYVGSDVDVLVALRTSFKRPEYQIVSCPDRGSATVFLKSDIPYHAFLFDIQMRDGAALDLVRLTNSLAHRQGTANIVVAEEVTDELRRLADSAGADQCIEKTNDVLGIIEALARAFSTATVESEMEQSMSGTVSRPDTGDRTLPMDGRGVGEDTTGLTVQ